MHPVAPRLSIAVKTQRDADVQSMGLGYQTEDVGGERARGKSGRGGYSSQVSNGRLERWRCLCGVDGTCNKWVQAGQGFICC